MKHQRSTRPVSSSWRAVETNIVHNSRQGKHQILVDSPKSFSIKVERVSDLRRSSQAHLDCNVTLVWSNLQYVVNIWLAMPCALSTGGRDWPSPSHVISNGVGSWWENCSCRYSLRSTVYTAPSLPSRWRRCSKTRLDGSYSSQQALSRDDTFSEQWLRPWC